MLQVDDGAEADRGEDVIPLFRGAHPVQEPFIGRMVSGSAQQGGHRASGTRPVGYDALGVPGHLPVETAQVTDRRLEVEDGGGSPARPGVPHPRVAPPAAGNRHHISFRQRPSRGVAGLRAGSLGCHVASDIGTEEYGCFLCRTLGHIDIHVLVGGVLHVGDEVQLLIGLVIHFAPGRQGQAP